MSETTVYRVRWDVDRYQIYLFDIPNPGLEHFLQFDGSPLSEQWKPMPVYSDRPRVDPPDIWHVAGAAVMVMDSRVVELLEPFISGAGELLPLSVSGSKEEALALNVLEVIDCIAPETYSLDDLELYPEFLEHRLPESGLFKIPQMDTVDIFYVERDDDGDSLKARIDDLGLRGLIFQRVWSSVHGAVQVNLFLS